ncbi:MAG: BatD family protein [Alphaproteobacteria bacterium]|nr:BatD family protein [Alphaproteobacteria bacterium]
MFFCIIMLLVSLIMAVPALAQIAVQVQPNPVAYGNPVELVLSSSQPFTSAPDLSVLQQDFILGGQQQRQSSQWVNGVGKTQYELSYTLFPNKTGKITIPELQLGSQKTQKVILSVLDKSAQGGASPVDQNELDLTIACEKTQIYPSQPLACTAQLIDPIGIVDGQIIPPTGTDFSWQATDLGSKVRTIYNGKAANLWRQSFAFTTTASGEIKIPAFIFQGNALVDTTPTRTRRISHWMDFMFAGMGTATRPVSALSKPFTLTVLNKPDDWQGWWLPSVDVSMTETYQMPQTIHVGEAIERTVVLSAQDVDAAALPIPTLSATPDIKVYSGLETREDTATGGKITLTFTIVPIHSGEVTIPSITVPWFDTTNRIKRTAVVPERTIFVAKGNEEIAPVVQPTPTVSRPMAIDTPASPSAAQASLTKTDWAFWLILVGVIGFSFVLGIIGTWFVLRRRFQSVSHSQSKKKPLPDIYPF